MISKIWDMIKDEPDEDKNTTLLKEYQKLLDIKISISKRLGRVLS